MICARPASDQTRRPWVSVTLAATCLQLLLVSTRGADVADARLQLQRGDYARCIRSCQGALAEADSSEDWRLVLVHALVAVGQYSNACAVIQTNLDTYPRSVRLRQLGCEVFRQSGLAEQAAANLAEINRLAGTRMWAYQDAPNLVALGKAALMLGADPRRVLEQFFDLARKRDPADRDSYLASGELALGKNDPDLAAKVFAEGLKKFPGDPDLHFGLARAYEGTDRRQMLVSLQAALAVNPHHAASHLLLADHLVDGEEYAEAEEALKKVLAVNPHHPEAWAYRAVLAHLRNDPSGERQARDAAFYLWKSNPGVDHLVGRKLSQKYRFVEGAAAQRQALVFEPGFLPGKIQLAQDLLRLGNEEEGWRLAEEVHAADAYDATAFNLATLRENMARFVTLTNTHFVVRMAPHEAPVYGDRVLRLLERARTHLSAKYGLEPGHPTIVEIFPEPKDFGVRTFGMPGNPGYLGVCFGSVITANSPAALSGHAANWEAVLWHEFCHVITLQLTRNKMPRWLSEGISVYEEIQANPVWGQRMTPRYREMVLGGDLTPLGELSAAFLAPKSEAHLQFAYYESCLAVEFLVERFGQSALRLVLHDLREGMEINQAIARHTAGLEQIEKDFAAFARGRALQLAPDLDFSKPDAIDPLIGADANNYETLRREARKLLRERKWQEAKVPLQRLLQAYPGQTGPDNAHSLLAEAHRRLGETNAERSVLSVLAGLEPDGFETYARLMELDGAAGDWAAVARNAERSVAVNPMVAQPYRHLAVASEALGRRDTAIQACRVLLLLDPPDPAGAHLHLARLLFQAGDPSSKRHLLQALEEAPRFLEGHRLLLQMQAQPWPTPVKPPPAPGD